MKDYICVSEASIEYCAPVELFKLWAFASIWERQDINSLKINKIEANEGKENNEFNNEFNNAEGNNIIDC